MTTNNAAPAAAPSWNDELEQARAEIERLLNEYDKMRIIADGHRENSEFFEAERDALRERMRDALYELAALVPDPSAPDFTLACQNPADVQCLLQAWAILHIDAAPERQGVTVPCTESSSSATPAAPDTKNYCNCPQCQTRDCPAGRELAEARNTALEDAARSFDLMPPCVYSGQQVAVIIRALKEKP